MKINHRLINFDELPSFVRSAINETLEIHAIDVMGKASTTGKINGYGAMFQQSSAPLPHQLSRGIAMGKRIVVHKGERHNNLVMVREIEPRQYYCKTQSSLKSHRMVMARCDCGNEIKTRLSAFRNKTRDCGCGRLAATTKHGGRKTPLYWVWRTMISRCHNRNDADFCKYGDRGIEVCQTWRKDFAEFRTFAENAGWRRGLQIDRKDNDSGYYPENVRIVTPRQNTSNRRNSRIYTVNGIEYNSSVEAGRAVGVSYQTVIARCSREYAGYSRRWRYPEHNKAD